MCRFHFGSRGILLRPVWDSRCDDIDRDRSNREISLQAIVAETHTHPGLCTRPDYYLLEQSGIEGHPVEFQIAQQHVRPTSEIQSRRGIIGRAYVHESVFFFASIGMMFEEQSGSKDLKRQRDTEVIRVGLNRGIR
jgi:hypothetical protein